MAARRSPGLARAARGDIVSRALTAVHYFFHPEDNPGLIEEQRRADTPAGASGRWASTAPYPAPMTVSYRRKTPQERQSDIAAYGEQLSPRRFRELAAARAKLMQRQATERRARRGVV